MHRYLEFCVNERNCNDESIHNYLIALYARLGDSEKLEEYLVAQVKEPWHRSRLTVYLTMISERFGSMLSCSSFL